MKGSRMPDFEQKARNRIQFTKREEAIGLYLGEQLDLSTTSCCQDVVRKPWCYLMNGGAATIARYVDQVAV